MEIITLRAEQLRRGYILTSGEEVVSMRISEMNHKNPNDSMVEITLTNGRVVTCVAHERVNMFYDF